MTNDSLFNEEAVVFGEKNCLLGVYHPARQAVLASTPSQVSVEPFNPTPAKPCLVFLSAGLLHRVGPYRFHVDFSRALSQEGFSSFRLDISGKGESEVRSGSMKEEERIEQDLRETLNFLEKKYQHHGFILIGLCSGADDAHPIAVSDSRVKGVVLLDGYGYRTFGFYLRFYLKRVLSPFRILNFLTRKLLHAKRKESPSKPLTYVRDFPAKERIQAEIQSLLNRGTRLLYLYTSGVSDYYNHEKQFFKMFSRFKNDQNLQVSFFPNADHTYSLFRHREKLFQLLQAWLKQF